MRKPPVFITVTITKEHVGSKLVFGSFTTNTIQSKDIGKIFNVNVRRTAN